MRGQKKRKVIKQSNNKRLAGQLLGLDSRNIYYQRDKIESRDQLVKKQIKTCFKDNPAYGHRRVAIDLDYNKKRISRVMKKYGLKPPRLWYQKKFLTEAESSYQDQFSNLIKEVEVEELQVNEVWSSDLTYIKYRGKFIYLAAIKDLRSREVVGAEVGSRHNADLVIKTLKQAYEKQKVMPRVFHSDRGKEFLNEKCITHCDTYNTSISVSNPGSPWQNSQIESFWSRFKAESGDLNRFEDLGELTEYIYGYIHYYNNTRIINKLKMSPVHYKQQILNHLN